MSLPATIVMNCAGLGTRLGLGVPKSLLDIGGRPLIHWQLAMLNEVEDIRVVVGFKAEEVVSAVRAMRNDVMFVFNHRYARTGTAFSLYLGSRYASGEVVSFDGDLVVSPSDLRDWLAKPGRRLGLSAPSSENPVYAIVDAGTGNLTVSGFSRESSEWEWTGLVRLPATDISAHDGHIFEMLERILPIEADIINAMDIDTAADFTIAQERVRNAFKDGT